MLAAMLGEHLHLIRLPTIMWAFVSEMVIHPLFSASYRRFKFILSSVGTIFTRPNLTWEDGPHNEKIKIYILA